MFLRFFAELRAARTPVSLRDYLTLLEAMQADVIERSVDDFYVLSRAVLIKDERHLDAFDRVFAQVFKGVVNPADPAAAIPEEWLQRLTERHLTPEEKALIESLGGWDALMETLKKRLEEQKERHQGGNKWIGTAGTSPFGAYGYNPEGIRIGQDRNRENRAVKVWDKREFKGLAGDSVLGARHIQVALRRLRRFARSGAREELDLDGTIDRTAREGYLDIVLRPERRNAVKVLALFDIGGSMDPYVRMVEELFSAARHEFKNLEYFYFHNCIYDFVWKDPKRRHQEVISTWDILHKFPHDWRLFFVGDATMGPYEITYPGGSVEHWNEEPGAIWLKRFCDVYEKRLWLNPVDPKHWTHTPSIHLIRDIIGPDKMQPLTLNGIEAGMKMLAR